LIWFIFDTDEHLSSSKFTSLENKEVHKEIKALKTILNIDLTNYFLNKLLLKPVEFNINNRNEFVYAVMLFWKSAQIMTSRYLGEELRLTGRSAAQLISPFPFPCILSYKKTLEQTQRVSNLL
jgi:hypothetical protein